MTFLLDTAEYHFREPKTDEQLPGSDLYEFCQNQTV